MRIAKEFTFDSAHYLKDYHGKCERLHGHTYRMRVTIKGGVQKNGLLMDFVDIKKIVNEKVVNKFDHANINDILEYSTAENMCIWAWEQLESVLPLFEIRIWETPNSFAIYDGK